MSHVWIDEGTVVIPFVNLKAAHTAFKRGRMADSILGISIPACLLDADYRIRVWEEREERIYTVTSMGETKTVIVRTALLILPAAGTVRESYYRLQRMAKIRFTLPAEVFRCLDFGQTLQSLERPMAPPDWPLYIPGSFNK